VQLQFVGDSTGRRYYSNVLGYSPSKSLQINTPRKDGNVILVREGQAMVVRLLSGNNIYGFTTSVVCSCTRPYSYLHLGYPKELETIVVRKAYRAKTNLVVSVQPEAAQDADAEPMSAVVLDISTAGALLRSEHELGSKGDVITIYARLSVADLQEHLAIPAIIRSIRKESAVNARSVYQYGVEFQLLEQHHNVVLHGYVYEKLIKS
jgi:c-di-GMP-binding flagellar brake protein YcgR